MFSIKMHGDSNISNGIRKSIPNGLTETEDPEMQAEIQYAREHPETDIDKDSLPNNVKPRVRKGSKNMDGQLQANGVVLVSRSQKNQRKSRADRGRGNAKKEGAGGKYTWGTAGKVYEEVDMDPDDPNYDSDAQIPVPCDSIAPIDIRKHVEPLLLEYFANGDLREAIDYIREFSLSSSDRVCLVQTLIASALDHGSDARELSSELLAELVHRRVFSQTDISNGFTNVLAMDLADLLVDCPSASELIGNFISRAIADLALSTDYVDSMMKEKYSTDPQVIESLVRAEALGKHKEQLHDIWGVGGGRKPVRFLSKQMQAILQEYLSNGDEQEVIRCLRELEVPHFSHELVYQAGVLAVEGMHERNIRLLASLLQDLSKSGQLTANAIEKGFDRFYANLSDLSIDVPPAYSLADWWTKAAKNAGFLPKHIADRLPRKGRKRIVSESGDGKLIVSNVAHPYI